MDNLRNLGRVKKHTLNTTEPTTSNVDRVPEDENTDAAENSSSFGDTISRNEATSVGSDTEVESKFCADIDLFGGFSFAFPISIVEISLFHMYRRKELTTHWRNFIRPLMWRCKWTELKIRELESQALKYTRELEANDQPKTLEPQQDTSDFGSKLSKPMKRRK
ncbi:hypothetical protein RND81_08G103400 [Saponaria officinalis]|uniref:Uncharacterized protein n=1 Tax=Saponaria officinalis TaxID=3572 RepID=A0AAW1J6E5_SAPOF